MDNRLKNLFDRQRFQQNPKLNSVIQDVESRYADALDDDDLDLVNAAGENLTIGLIIPDLELEPEGYVHDDKHE